MKFPAYNYQELEPAVLNYWKKNKVVEKLRKRNQKGKKFYFLQGPPYTSGRVHLGTAWNTVLKDIALRYKRSRGFNVWDRNGFDVHGLPTAHNVMAKHKLKTKEDIEKFGLGKFIKECKHFSLEMAEQMAVDFQRMGVTLDYTDSYMALKNEYMEGQWWLIKQAWQKKRLYLGEKVMTWCAHCETALAKHECEYKDLEEDSVFLKFKVKERNKTNKGNKVKGRKDEYFIIWTTTPWTIPFNLAIMVNPNLDYVKAQVDDEIWIVGKGLVGPLVQSVVGKKLKILEEFKGKELEGVEYEDPWGGEIPAYEELKKNHPNVHTVLLSEEYVDFSAGSGLVHCAPGCGPEDQEIGKKYNIPPFNTLNEKGEFSKETGKGFAGLTAKIDDEKFIEMFKEKGYLIATTKVEHDYPNCWRCKKPVIFRTTKQWFFKIEDLKKVMVKENQKVHWVPKTQAFDAWTSNLKDNSITRQRYWGTPVPIWRCSESSKSDSKRKDNKSNNDESNNSKGNNNTCGNIEVIGSIAELKKKAGSVPKDLHRPWIDNLEWNCKCKKGRMQRIPDVIDVWIDAGTASWNCLYYPQKERYFKDYFPADLILEATEQVRLWFSMLSICSQLALGKNCYKNVYMHGMLRDISGQKMSKSLGNIISPYELIDKHGVDVLRYYMGQNNAGQDINFSWDECKVKARQLHILWNVHKLLLNLAKENKLNPFKLGDKRANKSINKNGSKSMGLEEKHIISKLNSTIQKVTSLMEKYRLDEIIAPLEELFLELSRTYIQFIREKSAVGSQQDKEACIYAIGHVLLECLKMFNIISPFICEAIYLNLREEFNLPEASISHYIWPKANANRIDEKLEQEVEQAQQIIAAALHAREKAKLGLRWPVKEITVASENKEIAAAIKKLGTIIQKQTNTKSIKVAASLPGVKVKVKPDYAKIGPVYADLSPRIIAKLTVDSPETILGHLEKKGTYQFTLDSRKVKITRDMLIIERTLPDNYQESEFRQGIVYLSTERTAELEAEGYAREVMRQVQSLRKKAGLEKTDEIVLFLKVSKEMKEKLEQFKESIQEKVGAKEIDIITSELEKKFKYHETFSVKKEKFAVWFGKE